MWYKDVAFGAAAASSVTLRLISRERGRGTKQASPTDALRHERGVTRSEIRETISLGSRLASASSEFNTEQGSMRSLSVACSIVIVREFK